MGISRDSLHKHRKTGAARKPNYKKRKYELGRQAAETKIGDKRVRPLRVRGGHLKFRALRLETGNFSWSSERVTRKCRILNVVYNATSNDLVRTNTLVKGSIIQIDCTPFKQWYEQHYGMALGKKKAAKKDAEEKTEVKKSKSVLRRIAQRLKTRTLETALENQATDGKFYAKITSRPGQVGKCDGTILEGKELEFYAKKIQKKKNYIYKLIGFNLQFKQNDHFVP
ncbi:40S ribosomal protein S8 [Heterostelium album PN500]|uniref:40S ribosomal protein S8 n=1 Tax=Heterostelium pallidum (strain ATCC 26659 / Pp 5 / PN500) TaxID=670386 RepID=D3BK61_HETP5|nr:40S ribosomal protein S8 [Heterostelium album PN500]EFA78291.1 40S ribosomal protein S8 [Heterostelium album PN500]|eukprot:XP_020430416.1 40S ribosomal protein S8 [Heterostelium album PN500]